MNRIRELREARGLSQRDLGALVGVNQSTIDKYESGSITLKLPTAFRLAAVLECDVRDLTDEETA